MPALTGFSSRQKQPAGGTAAMREPDRIIRLKTVLSRTGLSRSTIYRKIAEGTFPAQLKISVNGSGWHESDIDRWIADPASWLANPSSMRSDEAVRSAHIVESCPSPPPKKTV
jgi:prophage regulatory protein